MPDVWVVWPSASEERHNKAAAAWQGRGYKVGVLVDGKHKITNPLHSGVFLRVPAYPGYFRSVNALIHAAFVLKASVVVAAADDMLPDQKRTAEEIAMQFFKRFPSGMGIMQPIGDDLDGTDRICGSPWIGRRFCEEYYFGQGPYYPYMQFYGDEELFEVARRDGLLYQDRDVCQRHEHWTRSGAASKTAYQVSNQQFWNTDKRIFEARKAANFPGAKL